MNINHNAKAPVSLAAVAPAPIQPPLRVGLLGLGTVGGGTYRVLRRNAQLIEGRAGRKIEIQMVAVRDLERAAMVLDDDVVLTDDPFALVKHPNLDVIVESIGGTTIARELVMLAIAAGKHVVTANKALLALHGTEIFSAARAKGVMVAYEGAVAVSIPIIKALREGLTANRISWVAGIINGTTNFILSEMSSVGLDFDSALGEAQRKGYAEQDPAFDVDGIDAAHKLALLASNAFGIPLQFEGVHVEGIRAVEQRDVDFAQRLGFTIKLLGIAECTADGISLRVHPALIPSSHLLAHVQGSMNAVMAHSDAAGLTMHYGAGAGAEQTASAVIADLVDVSRLMDVAHHYRVPYLAFQHSAMSPQPMVGLGDICFPYYLRIDLCSGNQGLERLEQLLENAGVQLVQRALLANQETSDYSSLLLLTTSGPLHKIDELIAAIEQQAGVLGPVKRMRIERLN